MRKEGVIDISFPQGRIIQGRIVAKPKASESNLVEVTFDDRETNATEIIKALQSGSIKATLVPLPLAPTSTPSRRR